MKTGEYSLQHFSLYDIYLDTMLISIKLSFSKCYFLTVFSRNEEEVGVFDL